MYKNEVMIEVRKNNFSGLYSIRVNEGNYTGECKWTTIKSWCKRKNIDCPKIKDMKLFSDGFSYSYGWFDGYGKVVGNLTQVV